MKQSCNQSFVDLKSKIKTIRNENTLCTQKKVIQYLEAFWGENTVFFSSLRIFSNSQQTFMNANRIEDLRSQYSQP